MRPKFIYPAIAFVAVFVVVIVLLIANAVPTRTVSPSNPTPDAQDALVERAEEQTSTQAPIPTITNTAAENQATLLPDAPALLESHCASCHIPQKLTEVEKPRSDWEFILVKMEALGVQLSETEKVVLLDYLAALYEP